MPSPPVRSGFEESTLTSPPDSIELADLNITVYKPYLALFKKVTRKRSRGDFDEEIVTIRLIRSALDGVTCDLFPDRPTSHIKTSPMQILGSPVFGSHLELLKITVTLFRLAVRILHILNCADIPGMSPQSIMPFYNLDPKLIH